MSTDELLTAAKASLEAYNDKNWDAARVSMAESCIYDEVATHRRVEGVKPVIDAWMGWATAVPDSKATIEKSYAFDGGAVLEFYHRPVEMDGDKAVTIRHYFDLATMMSQLGLV